MKKQVDIEDARKRKIDDAINFQRRFGCWMMRLPKKDIAHIITLVWISKARYRCSEGSPATCLSDEEEEEQEEEQKEKNKKGKRSVGGKIRIKIRNGD